MPWGYSKENLNFHIISHYVFRNTTHIEIEYTTFTHNIATPAMGLSQCNLFVEDCSHSFISDIQSVLGLFDFPLFLVWLHIKRQYVVWNAGFYF